MLKASKVTKAFRLRYKFKPGTVPHFRLFSSSSRQRYQVSVLSLSIPCSVKQSTKPNKTTGLRGLYTGKMKCLPESGCKPDNKESRSLNSNTWSLIPATKKRPLVGFRVRVWVWWKNSPELFRPHSDYGKQFWPVIRPQKLLDARSFPKINAIHSLKPLHSCC